MTLSQLLVAAVSSTLLLLSTSTVTAMEADMPRLVRFNATGPAFWMTVAEIDDLLATRHEIARATGQPIIGKGFMDITDSPFDPVFRPNKSSFPQAPRQRDLVNRIIRNNLEPGGTDRMYASLLDLTELFNRYYMGTWAQPSSLHVANQAQAIINAANRQEDASVMLHVNPAFAQMNIIATIRGTNPNLQDVLILGSHMDSINAAGPSENWPNQRAPGADDDGSGTIVVMHVFEALLRAGFRPERTIEFHWYAGEERGLLGSRNLAALYQRSRRQVYAMLQIDMAGGFAPFNFIMDFVNLELSRFEMRLVEAYCRNTTMREGRCGYACSDHASWHDAGYASSFPIEGANTRHPVTGEPCPGHRDTDVIECVDVNLMMDFARLATGYCIELSFASASEPSSSDSDSASTL